MNQDEFQETNGLSKAPRSPTPLLPITVGVIAGIVLDHAIALPTWTTILLFSIGAIAGAMVAGRSFSRQGVRSSVPIGYLAVLCAATGLGALRHAVADRWIPSNHVVTCTQDEPIITQITGRVIANPTIAEPLRGTPRAYGLSPKTRFVLAATHIEGLEGPIKITGRLNVSVKEPLLTLQRDDHVQMTGWLYRPSSPKNPGDYDWAAHFRQRGILAGFSCDHAEAVVVLRKNTGKGWTRWLNSLRHRLDSYLTEQAFAEDEEAGGVMSAMVLGRRSAVDQAMNEAFLKTGNTHFLAASGMHVGWLALIAWGITRTLGLHYRVSTLIVGGLILLYVLLAEPRPSILRAGIIGVLACLAAFFRGRYNSVNALACAALIILMVKPTDLFRPAFQFSFMATLGLLHFCPLVSQAIATWLFRRDRPMLARWFVVPGYPVPMLPPESGPHSIGSNIVHRFGSSVCLLFAVSISQWLITVPLACYHFDRFTPWGWIGTFVLAPFAMAATSAGFLTVLLGLIFPSSGIFTGPILAGATDLMIGCVKWMALLPGTLLDGRSPSLAWLLAVYAVFWLWGYRPRWIRRRHGFKILTTLLILWWLIPPRWIRHEADTLNVWMLAVGDGTETVIELPDGSVMIYDFGTRSSFDAGRIGVSFLRHRGIRHIDTVFVSHPNFDHYSGIETLAEHFSIGRIILNDQFETFVEEKSAGWYFLKLMHDHAIPIESTRGPQRFLDHDGLLVEAIWPPPFGERRAPDANDSSTVLRLRHQGHSILLTGDIAEWGMAGLLFQKNLHADVLALPHHGSVVHNTGAFIEAVSPQIAIRSAGQRRAMTTNGIENLVGAHRIYFNTADDGCVLVRIKNKKLTVTTPMGCSP
ncbi:MAG: ComEC/Rec2 family competence protein [Phycisphaerales bacterium]|nr:ComEC/Rec2 family competence protein [Phycisphaerales bacterium]